MSLFRSNRSPIAPRRFVPRLEGLEARDCPSATPGVSIHGDTLQVQGNAAANAISITDDGHGNVTATIDGKSAAGSGIHKIVVNTGAGNDTVSYKLTAPLAVSEGIFIEMGAGTSSAALDFTAGVTAGKLNVKVEGAGTDAIAAQFGSIAAGAAVEASLEGGAGNNTITTTFAGLLNGSLKTRAEAGRGNDTITTTASIDAGSTGRLEARVEGGAGADNLTLNVTDNTANPATGLKQLKASIEADPADAVINTDNVKVERGR